MAKGYYAYAILARGGALPSGLTGFDGAALSAVSWRSLTMATSVLDSAEPRPTIENLLLHEAVVEALCATGPVLPVRFGTVLADQGLVARVLAERYSTLWADLERLGDKVELGLAVLWDPEEWDEEESDERRDCALGPDPSAWSGPGASYLMGRLAQHRKEALVHSQAQALARELDTMLGHHALESRHTLLPTLRLALRAVYLVARPEVRAFQEAFEEARRARPRLRLLLSGPWPPYSFVTPPDDTLQSVLPEVLGASARTRAMR